MTVKKQSQNSGILNFVLNMALYNFRGGLTYQLFLCTLAAFMMLGIFAYFVQMNLGLSATNMSNSVSWGFYIANFTFLVGVAAAAVMLILPAYIFKDKDLHRVVIIGEGVAVGALVMCMLFVFVDLGNPLKAWHLIPGIGLFNWPTSLLTWDIIVLNVYLALNLLVPAYILYCQYNQRKPDERKYRPFLFLSIFLGLCHSYGDGFSIRGLAGTGLLEQSHDGAPFFGLGLCRRSSLDRCFAGGYRHAHDL